ncbi:FHS family L-fucose permease-like MFS transporter [Mucilaginibacter yixingensis]|uniref:FHS family L-fucose permease-like MFS transporter n=1 Tax=Mucilaginibacter yixingensis TaxID=1295612 RepID=A0A2T5JF97_9SPHI|nr:MFS transporter [Mucilaginibacter yixingensis]PTR01006.1 FHS family L-fucose permease-like MFS transporter [Mucilaginibacter yixingensis]
MEQTNSKNYGSALYTLITVFFFWGFVAASNDILIPVFKEKLHLEQWQSQMISFAFYVAYTVGSILYTVISKGIGDDILNKVGYKNGIAIGLVISALGTLLFYPAAESASFFIMISGLFIVGIGFSLQQIAANALAVALGDPKTGAQRLSLAGGVNNFGTTIGPLLVSLAIFGQVSAKTQVASISAVKFPYLILGACFILVAIIFKFSSIPNKIDTNKEVEDSPVHSNSTTAISKRKNALSYLQLSLGMIGIFVYVGVEVSTASNLPEFMKEKLHTATNQIAPFVSLYWASLMIGRWTNSIGAFNISGGAKKILNVTMPYIAFLVFLGVNKLAQHDVTPFYVYAFVIIAMIVGSFLSKGNPARQLLIFSLMAITALFIGMLSHGMVSVFAFISVGLFCSTLWPCIYTLSITGLGEHANEGSGYLIMMIMGGGFISLLQGWLAGSNLLGIQWSYLVGVACFVYLAFYAVVAKAELKKQGIDFDNVEMQGSH